ncbi:TetR/AcrR family transcriptional regulator [Streptomyces albipurpureus]|uniref:TetR/AcrR family transcriptional regulator n=1 Tax=Streptomyces albipurpureus TaxID=2897419 RepID=A0ABT0UHP8_9ACTN|nr:TetR/AcrR family transcriptional regulator [Streptomyces sp. CWNU-1]MCM2388168.1 TetR/AcrR family transcriptional regulator [Streptomyces sp. CWNU-1]
MIRDAARTVFKAEGLEGSSLRAIAAEAGYTPAALYAHFDSKEALYAEVLEDSLGRLTASITQAGSTAGTPNARLHAAAMAFFDFYAENPSDLDLGFYLFRGGMKPQGLGKERDQVLNQALARALKPISEAAANIGVAPEEANLLVVEIFAHAAGLLLLTHTGRIRIFDAAAPDLMERYITEKINILTS